MEQIIGLNNGQCVAIFYHKPYYSRPSYNVAQSDQDIHQLYEGQTTQHTGTVRNEVLVIKEIAKKIVLTEDKIYCGSITGLATLIDVFQKQSGEFFIEDNLWTSWNNSQEWNESIKDFSFRRFEVGSGTELDKYNQMGIEKMEERKNFFQKTMSDAISLGISKDRALQIVTNNNVTVLEAVTQLVFKDVPKKDARKIANKASAWSYAQVILGYDPKIITGKFENLISACREYANL
ncbi:MAG: hypothetical protein PHZ07_00280 [Patescibacteria group bacterium]|nr:hypothetical protein [Patescibacteria group bacterium]MDD4304163.1 hypothetical protein [Patescibacteria group bacterium]MDD4695194.1 hypothetical protein [Patescibacteria group bacterium]